MAKASCLVHNVKSLILHTAISLLPLAHSPIENDSSLFGMDTEVKSMVPRQFTSPNLLQRPGIAHYSFQKKMTRAQMWSSTQTLIGILQRNITLNPAGHAPTSLKVTAFLLNGAASSYTIYMQGMTTKQHQHSLANRNHHTYLYVFFFCKMYNLHCSPYSFTLITREDFHSCNLARSSHQDKSVKILTCDLRSTVSQAYLHYFLFFDESDSI